MTMTLCDYEKNIIKSKLMNNFQGAERRKTPHSHSTIIILRLSICFSYTHLQLLTAGINKLLRYFKLFVVKKNIFLKHICTKDIFNN